MTPKSLALSETDLQRAILAACNALSGVRLWRWRAAGRALGKNRRGFPGLPDTGGYAGIYILMLEVKLPSTVNKQRGKTAEDQLEWREQAARDGATVHVVTEVQQAVEIAKALLRRQGK